MRKIQLFIRSHQLYFKIIACALLITLPLAPFVFITDGNNSPFPNFSLLRLAFDVHNNPYPSITVFSWLILVCVISIITLIILSCFKQLKRIYSIIFWITIANSVLIFINFAALNITYTFSNCYTYPHISFAIGMFFLISSVILYNGIKEKVDFLWVKTIVIIILLLNLFIPVYVYGDNKIFHSVWNWLPNAELNLYRSCPSISSLSVTILIFTISSLCLVVIDIFTYRPLFNILSCCSIIINSCLFAVLTACAKHEFSNLNFSPYISFYLSIILGIISIIGIWILFVKFRQNKNISNKEDGQ